MPVLSTTATSRRGYLSQSELAQFADIEILDTDEADDQISQAEELIDAHVGFQNKFFRHKLEGRVSAVSGNTFTLETNDKNVYYDGQLVGLEVEIIGGAGAGQRRKISANTYAGVITVQDTWTTALDTTSIYRIYQLGKFPRFDNAYFDSDNLPYTYYKYIPEAVKRAVAAQVEYMISMGTDYFKSNKANITSERIGDYSYEGNSEKAGFTNLIGPKAKSLLQGITNRTGRLV